MKFFQKRSVTESHKSCTILANFLRNAFLNMSFTMTYNLDCMLHQKISLLKNLKVFAHYLRSC